MRATLAIKRFDLALLLHAQCGVRLQALVGKPFQQVGRVVVGLLRQLAAILTSREAIERHRALARERTDAEDEVVEGTRERIPDPGAVQREIDRAGHDLVCVMIEAASAQQPRRVQHEATSQVLKLRAREPRMYERTRSALAAASRFHL